MDVKADMGFLMALLGLISSDAIDRSQEVTNIVAVLIIIPCCTACAGRPVKILDIQHIFAGHFQPRWPPKPFEKFTKSKTSVTFILLPMSLLEIFPFPDHSREAVY